MLGAQNAQVNLRFLCRRAMLGSNERHIPLNVLDRVLGYASDGLDVLVGLAVVVVGLVVVARVHAIAGWLLAAGAAVRIAATVVVQAQSLWAGSHASGDWQTVFVVNRMAYLAGSLAFWASVAVAAAMLARAAAPEHR